jgi:hypothetical protein
VQKWKEEVISADPSGQPVINVTGWLSRTTLDIIGEGSYTTLVLVRGIVILTRLKAGFGFQFGSLDNVETSLGDHYKNLLYVTTERELFHAHTDNIKSNSSSLYPRPYDILFRSIWRYIPEPILSLVWYLPTREYSHFLQFSRFMCKFSQEMIDKSMIKGDGNDIMSVLLRANASEDPKTRLTNKEVRDQIKYAMCSHRCITC